MSTDAHPPAYYTAADLPERARLPATQHPGRWPFVRGIDSRMYTERLWRMRQYAGFGSPGDTNQRWKRLIEQGQHGVSCAFDLPTQIGLDSDDPAAGSDAGRLGVAIDILDDFVALFDGIDLSDVAATFNINASAPVIYAMLLEAAELQQIDPAALTGTLSNDPLVEFAARGLWRLPPDGSLRLMADTFAYSLEHTPRFYPVNLRATLIYEAGGSASQELGFGMACARAYLDELRDRGLDMDAVAPRFSFLFFSDSNFLEEACKFRAARMMWAEMMKESYGVTSPSGQRLRFTAAIGNFNLRAHIPELNLVRNTLGALGAVLGGCQGMLVAGMDEAFEIPSEYSSLLGLYTQQVIAWESHVTASVDPLGGSYYTEVTTDRLLQEGTSVVHEVLDAGGAVAAIEAGMLQAAIADSAYRYQLEEESGVRLVVGVNTPGSEPPSDPPFTLHEHDMTTMEDKRTQLATHRATRSDVRVAAELASLAEVLGGTENAIPAMRAALRAGATVGEIMAACAARYGEYVEPGEKG